MKIVIVLYDGVDLLDSGGPYEVFLTASRMAVRRGEPAPFEVVTATLDGQPVSAYGGLALVPQAALHATAIGPEDVVVVPGTIDVGTALASSGLIRAIVQASESAGLTASVCTGAFLLGRAGLLADRPWTTHWEDIDDLARVVGAAGARRGVRWVDAGPVVTAAGLSSGIAMALHLVDRLAGRDLAERTARQIDYDWTPEPATTSQ